MLLFSGRKYVGLDVKPIYVAVNGDGQQAPAHDLRDQVTQGVRRCQAVELVTKDAGDDFLTRGI